MYFKKLISELDDLYLHEIIFRIVEGENANYKPQHVEQLVAEAVTRDDIVLVTSAVNVSVKARNRNTLSSLKKIGTKKLDSSTLDTLLIDEFAARAPDTSCEDFYPFLSKNKAAVVRRFCGKVLFFDEINCDHGALQEIWRAENDDIVRTYIAGCMLKQKTSADLLSELINLKCSTNLDIARLSRTILGRLGY